MRIKAIVPVTNNEANEEVRNILKTYERQGLEFDVEGLDYGTPSIECEFDQALAVPDILRKAVKAAEEGFDGIYVDCFGDPGVRPAREVVDIPVFGGFEPAMLLAAGLGDRLAIVTMMPTVLPMLDMAVKRVGLESRFACGRSVDIPVLDLADKDKLENALYEESIEAIENDRAHVIVLGCTGMTEVADRLHNRLAGAGYDVPVIEPLFASIRLLETYISKGLRHSRLTYAKPEVKVRNF